MKLLHIHAHHDDFEFVAGGTFELWRRQLGDRLKARIVVCTDGQAGHHFRTRAETGRLRKAEQEAAAAVGGWDYQQLVDHQGRQFREGCLTVGAPFLAALWKAIRDFEPDFLFCPPLPTSTLAGVHPDHLAVAEGIRRVAYMINVPHAFTPEYPADETVSTPCQTPVIFNVHDGYMSGANGFDFAVDVEPAFDHVVDLTWCHQSQIMEWLPWVDRHQLKRPVDRSDWAVQVRALIQRRNREMGIAGHQAIEYFKVTAWGDSIPAAQLQADFPSLIEPTSDHRPPLPED